MAGQQDGRPAGWQAGRMVGRQAGRQAATIPVRCSPLPPPLLHARRHRWYAWATLLGTPPVYSAISNVKILKRDLAHLGDWGTPFILLWSLGMSAILGTVAWHVVTVARRRCWPDAVAYICSRLLLLAWFGGSAVVLAHQGVDMHLHHLYLVRVLGGLWVIGCEGWHAAGRLLHPEAPHSCLLNIRCSRKAGMRQTLRRAVHPPFFRPCHCAGLGLCAVGGAGSPAVRGGAGGRQRHLPAGKATCVYGLQCVKSSQVAISTPCALPATLPPACLLAGRGCLFLRRRLPGPLLHQPQRHRLQVPLLGGLAIQRSDL